MRRKDKQITDQKLLQEILSTNTICRLAFCDGDKPYVIPVNYGYRGNSIYVHTALEGKKLDLIKNNNNVCIEVTDSVELVTAEKACGYSTKYRSVICEGKVYLLTQFGQKVEGLKIIMRQHTDLTEWEISESAVSRIVVLKIDITSVTGKISGF